MRVPVPIAARTATVMMVALAATGLAFGWPLVVSPTSGLAREETAPLLFMLILAVVTLVVVGELSRGGLDAKTVALLGVLSALGAGLRPLGAGTAGVELVFFLIILGGRVFGPGFGFLLGTTTLAASALITAGVGPWLPYQMLGAAWVGYGAGLLPRWRGKAEIAALSVYGAAAAFLFGTLMNLSFWPFTLGGETTLSFVAGDPVVDNLRRFVLFNLATSMGWDVGRAITTVVMVVLFGRLVLRTLRRASHKAAFADPGRFSAAGPTDQPTST